MTLFLAPPLELDVANVAICLGDFYQGLLGCDLLCGHIKPLGMATITLPRPDLCTSINWPQKKVGSIVVANIKPQEPAMARWSVPMSHLPHLSHAPVGHVHHLAS